jgi:hypothetical protein
MVYENCKIYGPYLGKDKRLIELSLNFLTELKLQCLILST